MLYVIIPNGKSNDNYLMRVNTEGAQLILWSEGNGRQSSKTNEHHKAKTTCISPPALD